VDGETRESSGMRRTWGYVGMTEDEAQRSRWIFYEVVNNLSADRQQCFLLYHGGKLRAPLPIYFASLLFLPALLTSYGCTFVPPFSLL
jgi:hypothetical protein